MSVLSDLFNGKDLSLGNVLDRTFTSLSPSSPEGAALAKFANYMKQNQDDQTMRDIFAANPEFATRLYAAKNQQAQTEQQGQMSELEKLKLMLEQQKMKREMDRQSALQRLSDNYSQTGDTEAFLKGAAGINPAYANTLVDYYGQQQKLNKPDVEVKEVNGQLYRVDKNTGKATPLLEGASKPVDVKGETDLRKEVDALSKDFRVVTDSYNKIKTVSNDPSPAGDLSMIFSYMKLLDPASTVREGEFATAQNAAGVPTQIKNMWNKALSGERLAPEQRADFLKQAENIYKSQATQFNENVAKYRGLATDYGFNPDRIAKQAKIAVKRQQNPRTGQIRIVYSDGTTEIVE